MAAGISALRQFPSARLRQGTLEDLIAPVSSEEALMSSSHASVTIPTQRAPSPRTIPEARTWNKILLREYYLDTVLFIALLAVFLSLEKATPRRTFIIEQTLYKHSYPYLDNSVPSWTVPLIVFIPSLICFLIHKLVVKGSTWRDMWRVSMGLVIGVLLTAAITNCLKVAVGRLRPNFVFQCWPDGKPVFQEPRTAYGGFALCSTSSSVENEHRKSFPSGHSSWSASGLGYLTYYLLGQTKAMVGTGRAWRLVVSLIPALAAVVVGVSRIVDYWHHVSDVCVGLSLGFVIAFVVYKQLFPWFTDAECDKPLYKRIPSIKRDSNAGYLAG